MIDFTRVKYTFTTQVQSFENSYMITSKITRFLFRPIDIASLVFFRIIFGIIAFADVIASFVYLHLTKNAFDPNNSSLFYFWLPSALH